MHLKRYFNIGKRGQWQPHRQGSPRHRPQTHGTQSRSERLTAWPFLSFLLAGFLSDQRELALTLVKASRAGGGGGGFPMMPVRCGLMETEVSKGGMEEECVKPESSGRGGVLLQQWWGETAKLRIGWGAWPRPRRPARSRCRPRRCWWTRPGHRRSWGTARDPSSQPGNRSCGTSWPQSAIEMVLKREIDHREVSVAWPRVCTAGRPSTCPPGPAARRLLCKVMVLPFYCNTVYLSCAVLFILLYCIFTSNYDLSSDLVILLLGILFLRKYRACTRRFSFL